MAKVERRPMTVEETIAAAALKCCTFPAASWDKRFVRNLCATVTDKEVAQIWRLFKRYRRQINCPRKDELLGIAEQLAAPDFRQLEAQRRKQEELDALKARIASA